MHGRPFLHGEIYLYTYLCVSLAGFFAKRHMMFFLLSSFLFCPPLKNDGRSELRFLKILFGFCKKRQNGNRRLSPDTGKVATDRLTKGASWSRSTRMKIV